MRFSCIQVASVILSCVLALQAAASEVLYSAGPAPGGNQFLIVDKATGTATPVGMPVSGISITGLSADSSGTLFGSGIDSLLTIDPQTGSVTEVGSYGLSSSSFVACLAFDPTGTLYGVDVGTDRLLRINPETGNATIVASMPNTQITALAFDGSGTLYGVDVADSSVRWDRLLTINPENGQRTIVGSLGASFNNVGGMDFDQDGTLYATDFGLDVLLTIDVTTGTGTVVGPSNVNSFAGLAFAPVSIPEPSFLPFLFAMLLPGLLARRTRPVNSNGLVADNCS